MAHEPASSTDRRTFLQAGALATASAVSLGASAASAQDAAEKAHSFPGGRWARPASTSPSSTRGPVRERAFSALSGSPTRRGFAASTRRSVTSQSPTSSSGSRRSPTSASRSSWSPRTCPRPRARSWAELDKRLANMGTDYLDLFFIHSFGDHHSLDDAMNFVKSREFKEAADAIRKSGKAKFIGISTHHKNRAQILQAAAEGGSSTRSCSSTPPGSTRTRPQQGPRRVLEEGDRPDLHEADRRPFQRRAKRHPRGGRPAAFRCWPREATPFQGLLHAIWTDERISSSCVSMKTPTNSPERRGGPRFQAGEGGRPPQLRDAALASGPTLCADCDGRCSAAAGTQAELGNLTRFLTYHEHHGLRSEARRCYRELSAEARDWSGADLEAARQACPNHLDFARLLPEVDKRLA